MSRAIPSARCRPSSTTRSRSTRRTRSRALSTRPSPRLGRPTDETAVEAALPRVRQVLAEIARLAGDQEFLAGDSVTLADLMTIPQLYYFNGLAEGQTQFAELPVLAAWVGRMTERQSLQVTKPAGF